MSAPGTPPELSVVVPTLNEAASLPGLLEQLFAQRDVELEVIVADGGSRDDTCERARSAGARTVPAPRGRGAQMNAGAAQARAPDLLFLHADSAFDDPRQLAQALAALRAARVQYGPRTAGHFRLRFARGAAGRAHLFRHMEEKTAINRPGTVNGDQGALLGVRFFRELGGFDEQLGFLEDQLLSSRVFERGRWIVLPGVLRTSARRFEAQGHYRLYTLMSIVMGMLAAGVQGFFERAPQVYAAQGDASGLRLGPYLAIVRSELWRARWIGAVGITWRVGCFVRSQAWQTGFALDVCARPLLGPDRYPMLWLHDRVLYPLVHHRLMDAIVSIGVFAWFVIVLPPICAWLERPRTDPERASSA